MSAVLLPQGKQQYFDGQGDPLAGGTVETYNSGTSTPRSTWSDGAQTALNANPVPLDARGEAAIFWSGSYRVVVRDSLGNMIWTMDGVSDQGYGDSVRADLATGNDFAKGVGMVAYTPGVAYDGSSVGGFLNLIHGRTAAEIAALVIPTNFYIQSHAVCGIAWITRYGGAAGAADNTAAMNAAALVLAQTAGGGTIGIPYKGEWRMNWVCTQDNLTLYMPCGGRGEYNENCIRPFSLASAPLTIGNGGTIVRYFRMEGAHVSGIAVAGAGAAGVTQAAFNAPQCVRIYGATAVHLNDCVLYNGIKTVDVEPSATTPVFDIRPLNCKFRNDLSDSPLARTFYGKSISGTGFFRDVNLIGCKLEGPDDGYLIELDGTLDGCSLMLIGGYSDHVAAKGIFLNGAAAVRGFGHDFDAGANNVVIVATDQIQADPTRFLFGYITKANQRIQFNGTALDAGTLQAATANTATLRAAAVFADNELAGQVLRILSGPGAGQERQIASNVGATDVVTLTQNWTTNPTAASNYSIAKTIQFPSEADWFLYRPRINQAFLASVNYLTTLTDPYNLSITLEVLSSTGPVNFAGTSLGIATTGHGLRIATGANAKIGSSVLVAGTVVVANTSVTANSNIQLTRSTTGGAVGHLSYTKINGTSFTINSSSGTDTSTVNWIITEQT